MRSFVLHFSTCYNARNKLSPMKISSLKATNIELTPDIDEYIRKRIAMLDKVVDRDDTSARVAAELGKTTQHHKEGNFYFAEFNVHISGKNFRAVAERDDLYAAIDEAKDEIIREVSQFKNKQRTLIRRGGAIIKNILRGVGDFGRGVGDFGKGLGKRVRSIRFRRPRK